MKQTKQSMHIVMRDTGYELFSNGSQASYNLDGRATLKNGMIGDQLPDLLTISDARSLPSPACVSAESVPFGAELKWEWPKEADETWHASVRASWSQGEDDIQMGKRICFPANTYTISGVPVAQKIAASITLHNGKGQRSQPAELTTKSSDDASKILGDGIFTINNGQVFIKEAAGITRAKVCKFDESAHAAPSADNKIREIVSKYLTGGACEYRDELVDELKSLIEKETGITRLATIMSEQIRQRLKKEMQPGGLLHKR
ncbi:hypothetical protein [Pantoea agglomerans]|uniref:hypothetical protein n=1 Tax=Enterobacter agglomerans TaxID=549 RepID=UPI002412E7A8|nr:hypothetical protein [Pantoea agglomerans]